jgi:hypothetical protein
MRVSVVHVGLALLPGPRAVGEAAARRSQESFRPTAFLLFQMLTCGRQAAIFSPYPNSGTGRY